jgi:gluconate 5-dehydrogenase
MNDPFKLHDQHALITGGGTGIGYAIAKLMIAAGAQVLITGRREEALQRACQELGEAAAYLVHDVAQVDSIPELVERAEAIAPIDVLINNAGRHLKRETLETTDQDFAAVLQTNLLGAFALTREIAKPMAQRQKGCILMITSMAALFGIPQVAAYTASKSALQGLVRQLGVEFAPLGIRVNAIAPGFIETDMNRDIFKRDPARLQKILGRTPMGTLGSPDDIGATAVYLASPAAKFVTGVCIPVDGGASVGF